MVLSTPATPDTENLFDAATFAAMKPRLGVLQRGAGITRRRGRADRVTRAGHLAAAILDVTRAEPLPPDDPLWDAPNIFISPHSSTSQDRYQETLFQLFADNLDRYVRGDDLRNVVDRSAGY